MKSIKLNNISKYCKGPEGWFYTLLGCVWGYHLLVVINAVVLRLPGLNAVGDYARDIVIFVLFLFSIKSLSKRACSRDIIYCLIFFAFYIFQFIIHPENQEVLLDNMFLVFLVALPMYFIGYTMDINKLYDFFLVFSIGCVLFNGYVSFIYSPRVEHVSDDYTYSMGAAYRLLPHVLFVFGHFFKTKKIYFFAIFALGLLLLVSYGTRGPIVCVASFIVSLILASGGKKKMWMVFLVVIASGVTLFYYDWIVLFLDEFLTNMGSSTRLINKVYTDTLDDDSGRSSIINTLKQILNTGDKMSYGIFGSYKYVNGYAHRFYWDFWFSFGYVVGTIIMMVFAILFIIGRKRCVTSAEKVFWLLLFCNSIVELLFSSSYIINGPFYLFLGYCMSRIRNYKSRIREVRFESHKNTKIEFFNI